MKVFAQLAFTERSVDFSVANLVHQVFGFAAAAFGQQVVLVNAGAWHHRSAAQGAVGERQGFNVTQRLSAAQVALGNHALNVEKSKRAQESCSQQLRDAMGMNKLVLNEWSLF